MIKKSLFLLFLLFSCSMHAQILNWNTNISEAITISNKQRKPMLLLFTDATVNKGLLDVQILNTLDFAIWSRDAVVLVKLDLTQDTSNEFLQRNLALKAAFGIQDLPTICFANVRVTKSKINYELIGKIGYKAGGVASWISDAKQILARSSE
ncbi:hypothetical protein [Flavobacterium crassostreae]|uniref:Thioredoxin family protein n=1 Tax=Flavobacterium crassostreae TaxID=1763534 RepID=A0A1B9DZV1_9FLAO|nr:hypothetical protein [Flavobacterium crassostreae]OCB75204.1 hypothetical protein LPBF_09095 [Flavobacterium crassostreae]